MPDGVTGFEFDRGGADHGEFPQGKPRARLLRLHRNRNPSDQRVCLSLWHRIPVAAASGRQDRRRDVRRVASGRQPVPAKHALLLLCRPPLPLRRNSGRHPVMSAQPETAAPPTADLPCSTQWPREPYKGLNYFSAADAPLFGQRETEINDVVALLCSFDTRALLLHGGTGTGKSSFLRAGLCPYLQGLP